LLEADGIGVTADTADDWDAQVAVPAARPAYAGPKRTASYRNLPAHTITARAADWTGIIHG